MRAVSPVAWGSVSSAAARKVYWTSISSNTIARVRRRRRTARRGGLRPAHLLGECDGRVRGIRLMQRNDRAGESRRCPRQGPHPRRHAVRSGGRRLVYVLVQPRHRHDRGGEPRRHRRRRELHRRRRQLAAKVAVDSEHVYWTTWTSNRSRPPVRSGRRTSTGARSTTGSSTAPTRRRGRLPGSSWNFDGDPMWIVMVRR